MLKKIVLIGLGLGLVLALVFQDEIRYILQADARTQNRQDVEFFIDHEPNTDELAKMLVNSGVLSSDAIFKAMVELKGFGEGDFAAGRFIIKPDTKIRYLINGFKKNRLGNGNAELPVDLRVPSKRFPNEITAAIAKQVLVDSLLLDSLLVNHPELKKRGLINERFPAFFLPNTYQVYYDVSEEDLIKRLVAEYDAFWTESRRKQLAKLKFKHPADANTLASIVYAEQNRVSEEWSTIAGLYLNRLHKGIRLESDPTFKFCWGKELDGTQRLLKKHKEVDCPYNTYKYGGLPPGPINIPPLDCVKAVLNPKSHKYLFMCAKPDYSGKHDFSKNYAQHLIYARKYQRWLAAELRK